jgi:hypothetical protein
MPVPRRKNQKKFNRRYAKECVMKPNQTQSDRSTQDKKRNERKGFLPTPGYTNIATNIATAAPINTPPKAMPPLFRCPAAAPV